MKDERISRCKLGPDQVLIIWDPIMEFPHEDNDLAIIYCLGLVTQFYDRGYVGNKHIIKEKGEIIYIKPNKELREWQRGYYKRMGII